MSRFFSVLLRSVHIVAMALVLGGLAQGGTHDTLRLYIFLTVLSGVLLLALDLARGCLVISQGSGLALIVKLLLLGLGNLFPGTRLPFYLAATFTSSLGSHMAREWRHYSFRTWRVENKPIKNQW